jgi:F0F1-type ATP synthase assembly protein I
VSHTHRHPCVGSRSERTAVEDGDSPSNTRSTGDNLGWSDLLGMGATTAAAIALGLVVGLLVDHLLNTAPVFLFVGLLVGVAGAVWYLVLKFRTYLSK